MIGFVLHRFPLIEQIRRLAPVGGPFYQPETGSIQALVPESQQIPRAMNDS
jgi:hypothetical protein